MSRILVVDDEESIRFTFTTFLRDDGHDVATAKDYGEAVELLEKDGFDLVFTDIVLGDLSGIDLLRTMRERGLSCPVVVITGYPTVGTASDAVRLGAFDYITKPIRHQTLLNVTRLALQHKRTVDEKEQYRVNLDATFNSVRDGLVTVDRDLRVLQLNTAAGEICGHGSESIGKRIESLPMPCSRRCAEAIREAVEGRRPVEVFRLVCRHEERAPQVVSLSVWPLLDRSGLFLGAVMSVRDETRLARLEEDLLERRSFHGLIGRSQEMQRVYALIEALSDVDTTVLISGETGTGKELAAEALHYGGARGAKPLVRVNCSALSEELLESELFGHVRGSFTGAISDKVGRFERADGGTLFLDEIADISPRMQASLLRVLQEKEFERVGDSKSVRVDVRVIAATNKDLPERVRRREFREDLYYRLKVVEIRMPPLRARREDLPLLTAHFLRKFNVSLQRNVKACSDDVHRIFSLYEWPGNVRELQHAIEHAFIVSRDDVVIMPHHLPSHLQEFAGPLLASTKEVPDHVQILQALERADWNKSEAARLLGVDRKTLYRKMERFKIANDKP